MRAACRAAKTGGNTLGLVPTMGALHEGHLSLVRAARQRCQMVAVSIFVNPAQFGPSEDFSKYPRTLERDQKLLEAESVELLFAPSVEEIYPPGTTTFVNVEGIGDRLDGKSRPGHFRGVATVVAKLFNIAEPDVAFFGQKDAAQSAVVRRMVRDLALPVEIEVCPIVRDADGLALSSRNAYLSAEERKQALALSRAPKRIAELFVLQRERRSQVLIEAGKAVVAEEPGILLDFLEIVDPDTLEPVDEIGEKALVAIAGYVGGTRLIDCALLGWK